MNICQFVILAGLLFFKNVSCQLSLSARAIDPVTAEVTVTNTGSQPVSECSFQCRSGDGAWAECQCSSGTCNRQCRSEQVRGLTPGVTNIITVNRRLENDRWESYSVNVEMPFVDYQLQVTEVHRDKARIVVTPTTATGYISTSCSVTLTKSNEQESFPAQCDGSCSPCATINLINLDAATDYQVRVLPNFARRPEFITVSTFAYVFSLEEVEINENNATIRVVKGDAPSNAVCDLWIRRVSQDPADWKKPRCNHNENCPTNCNDLLVITELIADEEYELGLNSSAVSNPVSLTFKTGSVQYEGRVLDRGSTWIYVEIKRKNGEEVEDDKCHFFIDSIRYGRKKATCNGGECPDDCKTPANVTDLVSGVQYRLIIVPWKHGSFFYVDFYTRDVTFGIEELYVFPTKISLKMNASSDARGKCSYRLLDDSYRYTILTCQGGRCPTDCVTINVTNLNPNRYYELEIHSTYSSRISLLRFWTNRVKYTISQIMETPTSITFNLVGDNDYRKEVLEDCSIVIQENNGNKIRLTDCLFPPCGYQCANNNYTITGLEAGQSYVLYLNSTLSDFEHYKGLYTNQADLVLSQLNATSNTIEMNISSNITSSRDVCRYELQSNTGTPVPVSCVGGSCPTNCNGFTLSGLTPSSMYKLNMISNLKNQNTSLDIYTLYTAPKIVSSEVSGKQSIKVKWDYDFLSVRNYTFSVFATETATGRLLYAHAFYPPTITANLVFLPPSTHMKISVCVSPVAASNIRSCDQIDGYIEVTDPEPMEPATIYGVEKNTARIQIPKVTPLQGDVQTCYLYVVYLLHPDLFSTLQLPSAKVIPAGSKFIAASGGTGILHARFEGETCKTLSTFKIGDKLVYGGTRNVGLRGDNYFTVMFRACINKKLCSDSGLSYPAFSKGSSLAVYLILAIAAVVLFGFLGFVLYTKLVKPAAFKVRVDTDLQGNSELPNEPRGGTGNMSEM